MFRRLCVCVLLFSLSACSLSSAPRPEVSIVDTLVTNVTLLETEIEFTIKITNDTPEPLDIDGATYRIFINDFDVGTGSSGEKLLVSRFSSAKQKVRIGISNWDVFNNIRELVESRRFNYRIEADFYLKGDTFRRRVSTEDSARFNFKNLDLDDSD